MAAVKKRKPWPRVEGWGDATGARALQDGLSNAYASHPIPVHKTYGERAHRARREKCGPLIPWYSFIRSPRSHSSAASPILAGM
jgi:hypothetical protein